MILCQAGHKTHDLVQKNTANGMLNIYDWEKYKDFNGYCTGQDDVSKTIAKYGRWEEFETALVKDILESHNTDRGIIDFGAHIGWFSIMAARMGFDVISYEGDSNNCEVLRKNAELNDVSHLVKVCDMWVDDQVTPKDYQDKLLLKIDLEGNDEFAIKMCGPLLKRGGVEFILIEISPSFNGGYPALVDHISSFGYKPYVLPYDDQFKHHHAYKEAPFKTLLKHCEFQGKYDFGQANLLFIKQ